MSEEYDLLVDRLTNHLGLDPGGLAPDVTFEQLALDSFAMVELGLVLQEELGYFLPEELDPQATLGQAAENMRGMRDAQTTGDQR